MCKTQFITHKWVILEEMASEDEESVSHIHEAHVGDSTHQGNGVPNNNRLCDWGKPAVLKVVGPRSENRGLRYLCCDQFVFFGKRKNYCRFFEWVDHPCVTKEQKKEAQAIKRQKKEASSLNSTLLQPAVRTRGSVRQLENQCKTIEGLQLNKQNFDLEIRVTGDHPQTIISETCKDVVDALVDNTVAAKQIMTAVSEVDVSMDNKMAATQILTAAPAVFDMTTSNEDCIDAAHIEISTKGAVISEIFRSKLTDAVRQTGATVQDVQGLELGTKMVKHAVTRGDPRITQSPPSTDFKEVLEDTASGADQEAEHDPGVGGVHETLEVATCFCLREAVLKTVKSKGPNKGLRFWVCSNSRPFFVKQKKSKVNDGEKSCKFFRWVDTPFVKLEIQKDEEIQKRKALRRRKELSLLS